MQVFLGRTNFEHEIISLAKHLRQQTIIINEKNYSMKIVLGRINFEHEIISLAKHIRQRTILLNEKKYIWSKYFFDELTSNMT